MVLAVSATRDSNAQWQGSRESQIRASSRLYGVALGSSREGFGGETGHWEDLAGSAEGCVVQGEALSLSALLQGGHVLSPLRRIES